MKTVLLFAGIAALLLGLLFTGQGLGFMIGQMVWTYYGAGIFVAGIVLIALARR